MKLKELIKEADKRQQEVAEWMEKNWGKENVGAGLKKWERYLDLINMEVKIIPKKHQCEICGTEINIHDVVYDGRCSKCRGE